MQTIRLEGAITLKTVTAQSARVSVALAADSVTLDLAAVTDVDSTAVSMLMQALRDARVNGRDLKVTRPHDNILNLARLYGVETVLAGVWS
ncbi:STAS domain-containing protein [Burkholderiaceae bacterium DAT-1]|nr:STAS domain-containing protein [Burkholderiaceae bacterium DAT-1]